MAKTTKTATGKSITPEIDKVVLERLTKYLGDAYHPDTDSVDREYLLNKLRSIWKDLEALQVATKLMSKFSGKTNSLTNKERGRQEMIVFFRNRLNQVGYTVAGLPVVEKKD